MKKFIIKAATAIILISFVSASAGANQTEKNHVKNTGAVELIYHTEKFVEQKITIETWMTDVDYFIFSPINESKEKEIQLSSWMYDPDYFNQLTTVRVAESVIDLEAWMADPEYFYHHEKIITVN